MLRGPYDLSLVEGSITTPADAERILRVRRLSRHLVTIGACATAGGIQALRNFADVREFAAYVYPHPEYLQTLATSTPISAHVPVDFELRGCPIDKGQLLEVIKAFLIGRKPAIAGHSVCHECKRAARFASWSRREPPVWVPLPRPAAARSARPTAGAAMAASDPPRARIRRRSHVNSPSLGMAERYIARVFHTFNAAAEPFRKEGEAHGE